MRQVFLLTDFLHKPDWNGLDALPVGEFLLKELCIQFQVTSIDGDHASIQTSSSEACAFLDRFYDRYELSQPQRRVRQRFVRLLKSLVPDQHVRFVIAEASEHQTRRNLKKNQQLY